MEGQVRCAGYRRRGCSKLQDAQHLPVSSRFGTEWTGTYHHATSAAAGEFCSSISRVDCLQATSTSAFQFMTLASLAQPTEMQAAIAQGLEQLLKPQSAFITTSFMELFFDGFDVNCAQEHPAAQAICQQFQAGAVPGAVPVNATHYKFSLMGAASREHQEKRQTRCNLSTIGQPLECRWIQGVTQPSTQIFGGSRALVQWPARAKGVAATVECERQMQSLARHRWHHLCTFYATQAGIVELLCAALSLADTQLDGQHQIWQVARWAIRT